MSKGACSSPHDDLAELALPVRVARERLAFPEALVVVAQGAGAPGARPDGPLVVAQARAPVSHLGEVVLLRAHGAGADLDKVVVPARDLVGLQPREEVRARDVEDDGGDDGAADEVDGVVVGQVHRGPPQPHGVGGEERAELGEAVAHEQSLHDGTARVQRGERTEDHGRVGEVGGVGIDAEQLVDASQAGWRSLHRVVRRCETVQVLIPWRRAGKGDLDSHADQVHVSEAPREDWDSSRCCEEEHYQGAHGWSSVVDDSVGQPRENIKDDKLMFGEDIAQICAV